MSPYTVALVQNSWAKVTPIAPQAAELFYNHLIANVMQQASKVAEPA